MKRTAIGVFSCALAATAIAWASAARAATIFSDNFEAGVAGANVGLPWQVNDITPTTYQSTGNPFPSGAIYADLNDPGTGTAPSQAVRLLSANAADATLTPSIAGQVTTLSFDFWEPSPNEATGAGMGFGYYRSTTIDLNAASRNYKSMLHDGSLTPQALVAGSGGPTAYALNTVHTVFMLANDSLAAVVNYSGTGRTLAPSTADVWISLAGAAPTFAFSVAKENVGTTPHGIGFRSNNGDIERIRLDNVLLVGGATFDRTQVPEPATWALAGTILTTALARFRRGQREDVVE